ncbi:hypothetical protein KP509_22G079200 [Ceratopteris richardii]|nr:hypothetical protein KP509_22G079200 [Ceratopteris richardii]
MQQEGLSPNASTYVCILKVCGIFRALLRGQTLHAEILRKGLLSEENIGNVLLDMYAKCGSLTKVKELFDELPVQDVVSWSTLVSAYTLHSHPEKAFACFEKMQQEGIPPNEITFLSMLKACASIGAVDTGEEVHAKILKGGCLEKDIRVASALVDMYVKCSALCRAQAVFDELPARNLVLWTALITGYASAGKDDIVFKLYNHMIGEGIEPDSVSFAALLCACGNSGSLDEAQMLMKVFWGHGMLPTLDYCIRIIDLLGRAGHIDKAVTLINKIPFSADLAIWHCILGACQKWGNVRFGQWAFEHAIQLNQHDVSAYMMMSNVYKVAQEYLYDSSPEKTCII